MTRRESYFTQQRINEMQTTHTNVFIAQCRTCWQIVASIADDLAQTHKTAEQIDEWRQAGYLVSKVTRTYVMTRMSSRGCTCAEKTA